MVIKFMFSRTRHKTISLKTYEAERLPDGSMALKCGEHGDWIVTNTPEKFQDLPDVTLAEIGYVMDAGKTVEVLRMH